MVIDLMAFMSPTGMTEWGSKINTIIGALSAIEVPGC
jgi:hypothetical protein